MALLEREHQLEDHELSTYESYVQHSVDILSNMRDMPKAVLTIAKYHQERHNGSGYPQGVTGEKIPLLAKIAGLVDYYQSLITPRENELGLSPLDAVARLYEERDISFQRDLVERFIQAIGVYPTGTLVELNTSEVGIVTGHHEDRRLMPTVMVVTDLDKQLLKKTKIIDLKEWNKDRLEHDLLLIRDSLPKGAYDIDEASYLNSNTNTRWGWKTISTLIAG